VARLAAYRGIGQLGVLSLAAEVGDWRRFAHTAAFMAFTGLVPCERSSADSIGGAISPVPAASTCASS
jgi:transposase